MKTNPTGILRDPLKIPIPRSNPAAAVIRDTLEHHGVTQIEAAKAMGLSVSQLGDVIRQRRVVSAAFALRFQFCFGIPADFIVRLQAQHEFQQAYHSKGPEIRRQVTSLA